MSSALELQIGLIAALRQSTALTALMGGPFVYDDVPDNKRPPYVQIGLVETLDWSTTTEDGAEHFVEISVWSKRNGRRQAVEIASLVESEILSASLDLPNHHLINLTHEATNTEADRDDRHFVAQISFRAVTEPK